MQNKKNNVLTKNIQKSGKSNFVYLPTDWCKKFGLIDGGSIFIEQKPSGELVLHPVLPKTTVQKRTLNLKEIPASLLDKTIASSYLAGINSFIISGKNIGKRVEMIDVKEVLPGMELMSIHPDCIEFNCTIKLENIREVQQIMMKKVINQVSLIKHSDRKMTRRLEDDVDKNRFLIERALRTAMVDPVYKKELGLTSIKCLYLIYCVRLWERISDDLREIKTNDENIIAKLEQILTSLYFAVLEPSLKNIEQTNSLLEAFKKIVNKKAIESNSKRKNYIGTFNVVDYVLLQRVISSINDAIEITLDDFNTQQLLKNSD